MAEQKISELTELATVADGDLVAIVDDPSGTPTTKKITKKNLVTGIVNADIAAGASIADSKLASTFLKNVVEDTTPTLGGQLSANANSILWDEGADGITTAQVNDQLVHTINDNDSGAGVKIENSFGSMQFINSTGIASSFRPEMLFDITGPTLNTLWENQIAPADDTGTVPVILISGRQNDSTPLTTRPLLHLRNATGKFLEVTAAGVFDFQGNTLQGVTFDANGTNNTLSNVDVADLADGTDGELITWDASGNPATVAVGTSGQVLTSNGAGAAPTFQNNAAGFADPMTTRGDVIIRDATNTTTRLAIGTNAQVLT